LKRIYTWGVSEQKRLLHCGRSVAARLKMALASAGSRLDRLARSLITVLSELFAVRGIKLVL
jgi:hypothetical protein